MAYKYSLRRMANFAYHRRREVFDVAFWRTVWRVTQARFNVWENVSPAEFAENLRIIEQRPWNLHVELTNFCSANCIFCAYQYQTRPRYFLPDGLYRKVLDDYCSIGGGDLMLECVIGDPTVDPKFIQRIRLARQRYQIAAIGTITNAIAIRSNQIPELIDSGISRITVSSGPWQEDLYRMIYRTKSYGRMKKNVELLLETNMKRGCPVKITIAFRSNLTMKQTTELPDYARIAHLPHAVEFNTDFDTWRGKISSSDLLEGMYIRPRLVLEREPCYLLYDGPVVFSDGRLGLCGCRDYDADSELIVGDVKKRHLAHIWRSGLVKEIRNRFRTGNFPDICRDCTQYRNLDFYRRSPGSERAQLTRRRFASAAGRPEC